jgi:hypothetical protein
VKDVVWPAGPVAAVTAPRLLNENCAVAPVGAVTVPGRPCAFRVTVVVCPSSFVTEVSWFVALSNV